MMSNLKRLVPILTATLAMTACEGGSMSVRGGGGQEVDGGANGDPNNSANNGANNSANNDSNNGANNETVDVIDPGRVTLRRLNRAEYNNTVRDLLGVTGSPADVFPPDDFGHGFNNNGDVLTISPLLFEFYDGAAESLIDEAMGESIPADQFFWEAEGLEATTGGVSGEYYNVWSVGEVFATFEAPASGLYRFRVRACGQLAGPDLPNMELVVGVNAVASYDVGNTCDAPAVFEHELQLDGGSTRVAVGFTNDFNDRTVTPTADRNLLVDWIEVTGPLDREIEGSARDRIVTCEPVGDGRACAREILTGFAARAWRRPVEAVEVDPLVSLLDVAEAHGEGYEEGLRLGLKAILLSPNFIFRPELDAGPAGEPHALDAHELATRLSYFLWSSPPDDALRAAADDATLLQDDVLLAHTRRLLADERAIALVDNFASQWLYLDNVLDADPDYARFPDFDRDLRPMMREESRRFVTEVMLEGGSLRDLVAGEFTYVNESLATYYGLGGVEGDAFQRVTLDATRDRRRGLLTQGAWLIAKSYPDETSPVVRGYWILENMLCTEPAGEIPQDAMDLDVEGVPENAPLSAKLAAHRDDPQCAGCHMLMDPLGFAFEGYDPTGSWRENYDSDGSDVETAGQFPDGVAFGGAMELGELLVDRPEFIPCATEKMLTYATGRGVSRHDDHAQVDAITEVVREEGGSMSALIEQIVLSETFRYRVPEAPAE